ncbi:MAG: hypothetical protein LUC37_06840, partial [Prevotella sp.]|nr:hypothetical protein [Prevotella sp.]
CKIINVFNIKCLFMFEKFFGSGDSLASLAKFLKDYIPKGTNKSFDIDGVAFTITNNNGNVDVSIRDLK